MKKTICWLLTVLFVNLLFSQINQYHSDGTRHGLWEKKFEGSDQIRYTGNFNHGVEVGVFKFYTKGFPKQASAVKTFFDNGKKANIVYYAQNGKEIAKGVLIDKKREGKWEYYHNITGNIMTEEFYENDQLEGTRTTYYDNKQVSETIEYKNGKKEGKQLVYSIKGVLIKEYTYKNDLLEGINKIFTGKGVLRIEGNFKQNKKTGLWSYYDYGKLIRQKQY